MVTRVPTLDYTSRDREAIREDLLRSIPYFAPEWTDHNDTDFGIVLLTQLAAHLDVLHFYVDRMAAESFVTTAVKRESIVKLLRLIGFELRSVVPATADVTFTLEVPLTDPVTIPLGTKVQTVASENLAPTVFETTANLVIPAFSLTGTVSVEEGQTDDESLGTSSGQAFQEFPVAAVIIIEGSFDLFVDEGAGEVQWTEITSFVNSSPTDTHYRLERGADDTLTVFLGDGLQGKIPAPTSTLRGAFRFLSGSRGGVFGNVGAGTIRILVDTIFVGGRRVTLSVSNAGQASGGEDRQSIDEARRLGPASLRTLDRAVTPEDYKTLAEQFGGVAKARVIQGTSDDPCCACNLDLIIAPTGGGVASTLLKDDLLDFFDQKKMVGTCLAIRDPVYVDIDVLGTVFAFSNVNQSTVESNVAEAVSSFFSLANEFASFGSDLYLGNFFSAVEAVAGVSHMTLSSLTRRPVADLQIWTGDASFGPFIIGATATDEEWTLTLLTATTFSMQGSVSGLQQDGVMGAPYSTDGGEIRFTLTAGATPNQQSDVATFVTSRLFGNVPIENTEIMRRGNIAITVALLSTASSGNSCA